MDTVARHKATTTVIRTEMRMLVPTRVKLHLLRINQETNRHMGSLNISQIRNMATLLPNLSNLLHNMALVLQTHTEEQPAPNTADKNTASPITPPTPAQSLRKTKPINTSLKLQTLCNRRMEDPNT